MTFEIIHQGDEQVYVLVFEEGDEVVETITSFVRGAGIQAARIMAVGAFQEATLGYFDMELKDYHKNPINEQVEVASLLGNVAWADGEPKVHMHVVLGRSDGSALAGHLLSGKVRPTLEVFMVVSPAQIRRRKDPKTGLPLITLGEH